MPRWLPRVLTQVHRLAQAGRVRFTLKALQELRLLDLDADDALDVLRNLRQGDSAGRVVSPATSEWMYVFKPRLAETRV